MGLDRLKPHFSIRDVFSYITALLPAKVLYVITRNAALDLYIFAADLVGVLSFFKLNHHARYKTLVDIAVIDLPFKLKRFKVVYALLSSTYARRVNIHTFLKEAEFATSVKRVFRSAD